MTPAQRDLIVAALGYLRGHIDRHNGFEAQLGPERGATARAERLAAVDDTIEAVRALSVEAPR